MTQTQRSLGQILFEHGLVSQELYAAAAEQERLTGDPVSKVLLDGGHVSERELSRARAVQSGVLFADLEKATPAQTILATVPAEVVRRLSALPVKLQDERLVIAMTEPGDVTALGELRAVTKREVIPVAAHNPDLQGAIARSYPAPEEPAGTEDHPDPESSNGWAPGKEPDDVLPEPGEGKDPDLTEFLIAVIERGASDLHLTAGVPPTLRIHGDLVPIAGYRKLLPKDLQDIIYSMLSQKQRKQFEEELELDMSFALPGRARFRVNVFRQRDTLGAAMRLIPQEIDSMEKLGLPPVLKEFTRLRRGLVLVTGVTGSGKSTTLASLVDEINTTRSDHIMTVEDPIEFLHHHKKSVVNQREIGADTHGFAVALRHVLRQDPDVILVGEMRDLETIQTALTAAETGHLVFATLHTQDAPGSVDRIIDVFPPHQQNQIRIQLAGTLVGVVSQQLVPKLTGGRVCACEVLVVTDGVRNLIREGKTHQIYTSMQSGGKHGMQIMDAHLGGMVKSGVISYEIGLERCHHVEEFKRLAGKA